MRAAALAILAAALSIAAPPSAGAAPAEVAPRYLDAVFEASLFLEFHVFASLNTTTHWLDFFWNSFF